MTISLNPFAKSPTTRVRWLPEVAGELLPRYQQLAQDLDLVSRARAAGAENRPSKDDKDLDAPQSKIGIAVVEGMNLLRQFLHDQLNRAKEQIQLRFPGRVDPQVAVIEARAAVQEAKQARGEDLVNLALEQRRKLRQLRKFRADNGLSRDASYAPHMLVPVSILIAMIAVEMAANAALFAKTNSLGYVGGAFQALLFGVVNVALGFCAGFLGLRFISHFNVWYKALGFVVFAAAASAGLYWNLKVAHYRDQLEANADATFASGILPSADWLSLSTIESWALLLLGIVIFILAMLEGRGGRTGFSDPYCGYRSVDLSHREAESNYHSGKDEFRAEIRTAVQDARVELRKRVQDDGPRIAEAIEIADAAEARTLEVRDSIAEWIAMGGSLLRLYREENEKIRTAPPPDYFGHYPNFAQVSAGLPDASGAQALAKEAERRHDENIAALAKAEADLINLAIAEGERFLAEVDEIEERAQTRLANEWGDEKADNSTVVSGLPQIRRAS